MPLPKLSGVHVRVLGSLIEKALSTPDHYPMSLNALVNACNQSSNRDPVMQLDEGLVASTVEQLRGSSLVRSVQGIGSRVPKYQHLLADAGERTPEQLAVLCVLMLRGPQTLAELKARAARLVLSEDAARFEAALNALVADQESQLVVRLERRPGQKEARFAHRLGEDEPADSSQVLPEHADSRADKNEALELVVDQLRAEVAELRAQFAEFRKQFE